jgi:hypothetical protein
MLPGDKTKPSSSIAKGTVADRIKALQNNISAKERGSSSLLKSSKEKEKDKDTKPKLKDGKQTDPASDSESIPVPVILESSKEKKKTVAAAAAVATATATSSLLKKTAGKKDVAASKKKESASATETKTELGRSDKAKSFKQPPGGFPDSDDDNEDYSDIDSDNPAAASDMKVTSSKSKKAGTKPVAKVVAKSSSKPVKKSTKAEPVKIKTKKAAKEADSDEGSDEEKEKDSNATVTAGSGSTTAVDDSAAHAVKVESASTKDDAKPPSSPKKERAKISRKPGTPWGFWPSTPARPVKSSSSKPKESSTATKSSPPTAATPRPLRRSSTAVGIETEKSDIELKTPASKPTAKRASTFGLFGATPRSTTTPSKSRSVRDNSSKTRSRHASPERGAATAIVQDDNYAREKSAVSSKAAKMMGLPSATNESSAARRRSVKSKSKTGEITPAELRSKPPFADVLPAASAPDPYPISDDDDEDSDDNNKTSADQGKTTEKSAKRRSVAPTDNSGLADTNETATDAPSGQSPLDDSPSRKRSPLKRSMSNAQPTRKSEGFMGLFGLNRSKTVKEPRRSEPLFDTGRRSSSRREDLETTEDDRRPRRGRRSRYATDDEGFATDALPVTSNYEDAEASKAARKARRREKERETERDLYEKERDTRKASEKERREEERLRMEDEDKKARRAAREERKRQEAEDRKRDEARKEEVARDTEREERRARRRDSDRPKTDRRKSSYLPETDREADRSRGERRKSSYRDADVLPEKPRGTERKKSGYEDDVVEEARARTDRRKSTYVDGETDKERAKRRSSKRYSAAPAALPIRERTRDEERTSRRASGMPDEYYESRNGGYSRRDAPRYDTPYLGSGGDKTSSWVNSVNAEPPLPIPPEDVATVLEHPPELHTSSGEGRRRDGRDDRRRRRREPRERSSESGDDRDRRGSRRSSPPDAMPATKTRTSWFKKMVGV